MRLIWYRFILVPLAVAACTSPSRPREVDSYTLAPSTQWSGGALTVASASFEGGAQTARFTVGNDTVTAARSGERTFTFVLPGGPSGQLRVEVLRPGMAEEVGTVQRVGLRSSEPLGVGLFAYLTVAQGPDGPVLLAQDSYTWHLWALSLRTGGWLNTGTLNTTAYKSSASYLPRAYVLTDTVAGVTGFWRLDTAGFRLQSTSAWLAGARAGVLVVPSPGLEVWCPSWPGWDVAQVFFESGAPYRSYVVACNHATYETGAPVVLVAPGGLAIDAASGDSLYTFSLQGPGTSATWLVRTGSYTAARNELVIASYVEGPFPPYPLPDSLHRIDAATGVVRAQGVASMRVPTGGIAPDPDSPRVYVAGVAMDSTLHLLVYDQATLALLGTLPTGYACVNPDVWCDGVAVSVDPVYQRIDLVLPGESSHRYTFDRLP